ncbi:MAG: hypothetical protein QM638_10760 [Nocardioides sp.]|uniref:hypothetical protein n=1 Tax=Nocardioides sp. TaxID=35761 RepID=UPI0039E4DCB1
MTWARSPTRTHRRRNCSALSGDADGVGAEVVGVLVGTVEIPELDGVAAGSPPPQPAARAEAAINITTPSRVRRIGGPSRE